MKIALCQINPTVGAFSSNLELLTKWYSRSVKAGAELVVFPELVVTGYPPSDLLHERDFIIQNEKTLSSFTEIVSVPAIVGCVRQKSGKLYNSAVLIKDGSVRLDYDKLLLPTYDVFDEDRYFTAGKETVVWQLDNNDDSIKIGIEICEDLWDDDYPVKVTQALKEQGADLIINISASPYHEGRLEDRLSLIRKKIADTQIPFFYCNLVGGQDELIFDGQSLIVSGEGRVLAQGKAFQEDFLLVDIDNQPLEVELQVMDREEEIYHGLCLGVRDYIHKVGYQDVIIGLSGGIDSSLVACIAAEALDPQYVHGIAMPSRFSSEHSVNDARQLAENLGIDFKIIPIQSVVDCFEENLKNDFGRLPRDLTEENNQARIRGDILMAFSNKMNWLVLSCGNKTELALGYCTLYGDMVGGLAVISDLSKTDVYNLAGWVNTSARRPVIPGNCITKPPSAELSENQVDPFDYVIVSPLVDAIVEERQTPRMLVKQGYDPKLVQDIYQKVHRNEYKRRQAAPGLRVSPKAFGSGRRIPIVNHFEGITMEESG